MKRETAKRIGTVAVFSILLSLFISAVFVSNIGRLNAESTTETVAGITYDTTEFTVTEDYSAFVDTVAINSGVISLVNENREQKTQLDKGKSGLLVRSVDTGNDVEGKSFKVENKLFGDFNLDFRVFSEMSYEGLRTIGGNNAPIDGSGSYWGATMRDDRWNPYMDIRSVGIKITSATDKSKAFTVYVDGGQQYNGTDTKGRVYIEGEEFRGAGRKGYGLSGGTAEPTQDFATRLQGTTFCNYGCELLSYSNVVKFDIDTMSVYGTAYALPASAAGRNRGSYYTETDLLIRNIGTNNLTSENTGTTVSGDGLKTLAKSDFANGYYVDIVIESMTGDDIPLTKAVAKQGGDGLYNNAEAQSYLAAYARTANIVLYNLNGQDFRKTEGWDIDTTVLSGGVQLTSKATGTAAEGNTIKLDTTKGGAFVDNDGNFKISFTALAKNYATVAGAKLNDLQDGGLGKNIIEGDPYSDVREVSLTFRSKSDATKAFTVYLMSRDAESVQLSAKVAVEGEQYRNCNGEMGFGGNQAQWGTAHTKADGSFGMYTTGDKFATVEFKGTDIFVGGSSTKVRDLSWALAMHDNTQLRPYIKTLTVADFAGGYDAELNIESVNPNFNKGLKTIYNGNGTSRDTNYTAAAADGRHIFEEAYDREVIIQIAGAGVGDVIFDTNENPEYSDTVEDNLDVADYISYNDGGIEISPKLVTVLNKTACIGSISYSHESQSDSGTVTLTDGCGTFSPNYVGVYTFSYNGLTQEVLIKDTTAPTVILSDNSLLSVTYGNVGADPGGASATDDYDASVSVTSDWATVITNSTTLGTYAVTYSATDAAGNVGTAIRQIKIEDKTAPVITLIGDATITVTYGNVGSDPGATASDDVDTNLTVTSDWASVITNATAIGSHTVTYNVSDAAGNAATAVTRTVIVADSTAPVITLVGDAEMTVAYGNVGNDPGATASDDIDTNLTVTSDWASVITNTTAIGSHTVTYNVSDAAGNAATAVTRTVIIADRTAPIITLVGDAEMTVTYGDVGNDPGATASDDIDTNLTVTSDWASVITDTTVPGSYTVKYNVSDAAGNAAAEVTRTVIIVDDDVPVITIVGGASMKVFFGKVGDDPGATATDNVDGDLTLSVVSDWDMVIKNTTLPGTYTVTYTVSDSAGNAATAVTRTVVIEYSVPVLTAADYESAAAKTAIALIVPVITDGVDGTVATYTVTVKNADGADITESVYNKEAQTLTFAAAGEYQIIYSATNTSGQTATLSKTITIEKVASGCGKAINGGYQIFVALLLLFVSALVLGIKKSKAE